VIKVSVFLGSLVGRKLVYIVLGIIVDILSKKYGWDLPDSTGMVAGGAMATTTAIEDFAKHLAAGKQKAAAAAEKARLKK